uniref:Zinc finger homeobox protein 2 n=1 Tax=Anthurium amnicola TaxID=1678845 RepID=A0A1D1YLQ5_9ARAE
MMRSSKNIAALLILVVLAVFVSADITVLNTPPTLIQNQIYQITWTYAGPADAKGQLIITDSVSNTPKLISAAVPLQPNSFPWTVDVGPGKYYFTLTEAGTANTKTSGVFSVVANDGTTPPGSNTTVPATPVSTGGVSTTTSSSTTSTTSATSKPTAPAGSGGSSAPSAPPSDGSKPASSIFVTVLLPLVFAIVQMI